MLIYLFIMIRTREERGEEDFSGVLVSVMLICKDIFLIRIRFDSREKYSSLMLELVS